ncbi:MAG: cytochrome c [Deltaproteobacteria bacterium]|nr:cytochrome c [Deltaproteobacteria bacterium]
MGEGKKGILPSVVKMLKEAVNRGAGRGAADPSAPAAASKKPGFFWGICISMAVIYGAVKWLIPFASRRITGMPFALPVPGTLMLFYMALAAAAMALYVTFSDERFSDFTRPVKAFFDGSYGTLPRGAALVIIPLLVGWLVYDHWSPNVLAPLSLRIQHPSSNFPKKMEDLKNPFANPEDANVNAFIEEAKSGHVEFVSQVGPDVAKWKEANPESHALGFIPSEQMVKFLSGLKSGNVSKEIAKAALMEKNLFEGRALYAMNCRPCHGDSVSGDGPMADGFKLRPINFTDNGTIETIVEGYTFWRISTGGVGLPIEATPWDSAMPAWNQSLTEDERWKIMFAEYDMAQKTPRMPEKH